MATSSSSAPVVIDSRNRLRLAWLAAILSLAACFDAGEVCGAGVCPTDTVCEPTHVRCVYPEQTTSCIGRADGVTCDIGGNPIGFCHQQVCLRAGCGDGLVLGSEDCDGENLGGHRDCTDLGLGFHQGRALRCQADCSFDLAACGERCGDGIVNGGEECDGEDLGERTCTDLGFYGGALACSSTCELDRTACSGRCGDGVRTAGEACDGTDFGAQSCTTLGFYGGALTCSSTCDLLDTSACVGRCGDDARTGPEVCDGSDLGGLSCEAYGWYGGGLTCGDDCVGVDKSACTGYCGDGVVNGNEQCDGHDQDQRTCIDFGGQGGALGCDAQCRQTIDSCYWGRWRSLRAFTDQDLEDSIAFAWDDVWVVTMGYDETSLILHFDGGGWLQQDSPVQAPRAIWGTRADDLWIGGDQRNVMHFDGQTWTAYDVGFDEGVTDLWGTARDDVWAVGERGVAHWNGERWDLYGVDFAALSVWTGERGTVWVGGRFGFYYFDGSAWAWVEIGERQVRGVWGSSPRDVYAIGPRTVHHFDGQAWTVPTTPRLPGTVETIWGAGPDDVWVGGRSDSVLHFDGRSWTALLVGLPAGVTTGWSSGPGSTWVGSQDGGLRHFDGGGWRDTPKAGEMWGVWGTGNELWTVGHVQGTGFLSHFDGTTWTEHAFDGMPWLWAIWGNSARDLWTLAIYDGGPAYRFDGERWTEHPLPTGASYYDLWSAPDGRVWLAGEHGRILSYDGSTWSMAEVEGVTLFQGIHGVASDDVWAVGDAIAHFDGTTWTKVATQPFGQELSAVWAINAHDVWAVGPAGYTLHYDGVSWRRVPVDASRLRGIWARSPTDVWASGFGGSVVHFDGTSWAQRDVGHTEALGPIWGQPDGRVWTGSPGHMYDLVPSWPHRYGGACTEPRAIYCGSILTGEASSPFESFRLDVPVTGDVAITLTPRDGDLDLLTFAADDRGGCALDQLRGSSTTRGTAAEQLTLSTRQGESVYLLVTGPGSTERAPYGLTVTCAKR
jgi:hypothetical protein